MSTASTKGKSNNTNGGTEISFVKTPQAKDDVFGSSPSNTLQYVSSVYLLDVMANDLGGSAKQLWSVDNGVNQYGAMAGHEAGDLLTQDAIGVANPANVSRFGASLSITADGRIAYDTSTISGQAAADLTALAEGETLSDSFIYAIRLANGTLSWAKASIVLTGVNDTPVVQNVSINAVEDGTTVTGNFIGDDVDSDDDGSTLQYTVTVQPAIGTLTNNLDGTFTYDPGSNFQELAEGETKDLNFAYTATDKHGAISADPATGTITVTGINDRPTLESGSISATENDTLHTIDLATLGDDIDSDDDGNSLTYTLVNAPPQGQGSATITGTTLNFNLGNDFQKMAEGEEKTFNLTIEAKDQHGATITNDITVTVTGINDAPTITGGDVSGSVAQVPGSASFTVQQYTGYSGSYDVTSLKNWANTHAANYVATTNIIDYTDDPNGFSGEIPGSTPWPAAAATGASGTGGVNNYFFARITGQLSVSSADTYTFRTFNDDGVYLYVNNQLIINDATLHPEIPFTGNLSLTPGVYPIELFFFEHGGEASLEFTYKNSTGTYGHVNTSKLSDSGSIQFDDLDWADTHTVSVAPVGSTIGTLNANKTTDTTGTGAGGNVSWAYQVDNAKIAYLGAGQSIEEKFSISVDDNKGGTADQMVTVTVTGVNDGPVAKDDNVTTDEDTSIAINVLGNDTDPDSGDTLSLDSANGALHGTLSLVGNDVIYTPNANYNGSDSFSYTIKDSVGATSTASVTVTVDAVSDTYTLSNLIKNGSFESDTTDWTVIDLDGAGTLSGVDVLNSSSGGWQAADGLKSLDLNAFLPGGVKQTISTVPGESYSVGFMLSKNPGFPDDPSPIAAMHVEAAINSMNSLFNQSNTDSNMMWQQWNIFTFTATDASTELSFTSLTPGSSVGFPRDAQGPALDEVVVVYNKIINGFDAGVGGDVLDLNDLLASINAPHDGAAFSSGYLKFQQDGSNTLVQIDANGGGNAYLTVATLVGVDPSSLVGENYVL